MTRMVKGEGKIGCIFWGLLVAVVAVMAVKVVPHQVSKMQLQDSMKDMALTAPRKPAPWFEREIIARAITYVS